MSLKAATELGLYVETTTPTSTKPETDNNPSTILTITPDNVIPVPNTPTISTNNQTTSKSLINHNNNKQKTKINENDIYFKDLSIENIFELTMEFDNWCPCIRIPCCCHCCQFGLTSATITAGILGSVLGIIIQTIAKNNNSNISPVLITLMAFPGNIWVRSLKLLVLPLLSLMMLILPLRIDNIGNLGRKALPLFLLTSSCAAIQGISWVNIIKPGLYGEHPKIPASNIDTISKTTELDAFLAIFINAVPDNIISAMSSLQILGVIVFFFVYGLVLRTINKDDQKIVLALCKSFLRCTMVLITYVVWFTPIGMFSMVVSKIISTANFFGLLQALGMYLVTATVGQLIHGLIVLPLICLIIGRVNPYKHLWKILAAPLTAFATSSSAATLPRSLTVAEEAKITRNIYQFILTLGSAINMDGTAQGFPIMIMFIAQLYGRTISIPDQISLMVLSIIISIGTAPLPNAGVVYLVMLLTSVGMSDIADEAVATILILDWFIDRLETAINVTSDQFITKMVDEMYIRDQQKKKRLN